MGFEVLDTRLPGVAPPTGLYWGYGTSVVAVPGTSSMMLSLPSGGSRTPWCTVDLVTGALTMGRRMPGGFRAAVFLGPDDVDSRPWVLGAFGFGRAQLQPPMVVSDVVRAGIGKYKSTLLDINSELLGRPSYGALDRMGRSMLLVKLALRS